MRDPGFRTFWLSMLCQWSAFSMQAIAYGWFLYELTSSPFLLGLMGASQGIPMVALAFLGGALADRVEKRRLLLLGTLAQGLTMAVLALLVTTGVVVWWHLLIASAVQGVFFGLTIPARQSAVPQLVKRGQLMNALSLNNAGMNVTGLVAPALAGFLLLWIGTSGVYWVMTGLGVMSAVVMLKVPELPPSEGSNKGKVGQGMLEGLQYSVKDVTLLLLLIVSFVSVAFGMPLNNLLPVFSRDVLSVGAGGLGLLMSMGGIGALIGSVAVASLADVRRKGLVILLSTLLWGASVVAFAATRSYALALLLMVLVGFGQSGRNVLVSTVMLARAPEKLRGRVISLSMMAWGLQPLGVLPIGAAAQVVGAPLAVALGGLVVALLAVGMLTFSPRLRRLS